MSWWKRFVRGAMSLLTKPTHVVQLALPGWTEAAPTKSLSVWRDHGDELSLSIQSFARCFRRPQHRLLAQEPQSSLGPIPYSVALVEATDSVGGRRPMRSHYRATNASTPSSI